MNGHINQKPLVLQPCQFRYQYQMGRGGYGQKLCNTLNSGENYYLYKWHVLWPLNMKNPEVI